MSRDYLGNGMRGRASEIATLFLGRRTERDIYEGIIRDIEGKRLTRLDREILSMSGPERSFDFRREHTPASAYEDFRRHAIGRRLKVLEDMGLAEERAPGLWLIRPQMEKTLKSMGERGDIIKAMHRRMRGREAMLDCEIYGNEGENGMTVFGVVVDRGFSDELDEKKRYIVVNSTDCKAYYLPLSPKSEKEGFEAEIGSIVTVSNARPGKGAYLQVETHSQWSLDEQVKAEGPTWLDAEIARKGLKISKAGGKSAVEEEIQKAKEARARVLEERGLGYADPERGFRLREGAFEKLEERQTEKVRQHYVGLGRHLKLRGGQEFQGKVVKVERLSDGPYAIVSDGREFTVVPFEPGMPQLKEKDRAVSVKMLRERKGFERVQVQYKGIERERKVDKGIHL